MWTTLCTPEHVHALRRSGVVAAETRRRIHGARMPIPVQGTGFTRVLEVAVPSNQCPILASAAPVKFSVVGFALVSSDFTYAASIQI